MNGEEFKVLRIWKSEKEDTVRGVLGHADVQIGDVRVRFIKVIKDDRGRLYCGLPSRRIFNPRAGKLLNTAIIHIESSLKEQIYSQILELFRMEELKFKGETSKENGGDRT